MFLGTKGSYHMQTKAKIILIATLGLMAEGGLSTLKSDPAAHPSLEEEHPFSEAAHSRLTSDYIKPEEYVGREGI